MGRLVPRLRAHGGCPDRHQAISVSTWRGCKIVKAWMAAGQGMLDCSLRGKGPQPSQEGIPTSSSIPLPDSGLGAPQERNTTTLGSVIYLK